MYLKCIEVHGFKSFANKMVLKFDNGITGIVGPNGSGKSNVADAVRWVLGEQRVKQLRGSNMQDVIFSGTELRKPMGYAYVAITLDNSDHQLAIDYDEVTVARRIYRSGESEYLINGSICRLKDVNELFYDTGIGKEGYSIIGQGQIDRILSGKPEERRELFDEAAGIVKFKRRKAAAVKKLEDEKQNLVRVSDILSELEKQVKPLEKQSEKAREYLKLKEELKTLDVNVFLLENKRVNEQLEEVKAKYDIALEDYTLSSEKYENIKREYEAIQEEIDTLDATIEENRSSITDSGLMKGKLEGEINVLKEQIRSLQDNEEHFLTRQKAITEELDRKQIELDAITADKDKCDEQFREVEAKKEEAGRLLHELQTRIEELNNDIEAGKNTIIETLNNRAAIKVKLGTFDANLEQLNIRKSALTSKILQAKTSENEQRDVITELEDQFNKISDEITELNNQQTSMDERLHEIHDELGSMDQKLRDTQVKYHQEKSKLEALTNLTERYEGYGGSVKRVMEQKDSVKGIIGVVADIIQAEEKYEIAIETALGGNIQNIVTEDEETAKKMIAFLKQNKGGRATFLPLTSLEHPQEFKTPEVLEEKGVIGMACDLVKTGKRYTNVAKAMLGRIVVVDNVDNAVKIARKYDYGIRMVTLEGELLVPGGAISGGAFKNNSNLLGRRREMDELEAKIKNYLKEIDELLNGIEKIKEERNKLRRDLEDTKSALQDKFLAQNTARLNVMQAKEKMDEAERGFDALKEEEAEIEQDTKELLASKEEVTRQISESEVLEKTVGESIVKFQSELDEKRELESEQARKLQEQEVAVEKMRQQTGFHNQNLERITEEINRSKAELEEINTGLKIGQDTIALKQDSIRQIEETLQASHTYSSKQQEKLNEDIKTREELVKKQRTFFETREKMSEHISAMDKEVYRLNAQKEKFEESLESHISYMWNEYEITLKDASELRNPDMTDLSEMKKSIAGIKDGIKKLGDVNVNAIEDYKTLMERYTFLHTQHEDLVEAEKTLNEIIEELDGQMRKQFEERFSQIEKEFDKVFKELFGGGKASLELIEDEDILEAGIRIIAQPPGKKLQNMMQLSGGEKALSAIALLFAIQNLKPSPFCLLDEIEAALDENNVGRFAKYLHKLTKHTQFIVITHRRGTMETADRLYGITMQEKGVSALVSVNLIDQELDD